MATLKSFFTKFNNDWGMNLAAMLAYNLLGSIFPLIISVIAILGLVIGTNGALHDQIVGGIAHALPGNVSKTVDIAGILNNFTRGTGFLGIIGLLLTLYAGSNFFVSIESAFCIIFRLENRPMIRQRLVSIGMVLLFIPLAVVAVGAAILPSALATSLGKLIPLPAPIPIAISLLSGVLASAILFYAIYAIMPNTKIEWQKAWKGALVASVLLQIITAVFPLYTATFVNTKQYGAALGTVILVMLWFWFFSLILVLGAEVNSFFGFGQRETSLPLPGIMNRVQAHGTVQGAAGPTAGTPQEHLEESSTPHSSYHPPSPGKPGAPDQEAASARSAAQSNGKAKTKEAGNDAKHHGPAAKPVNKEVAQAAAKKDGLPKPTKHDKQDKAEKDEEKELKDVTSRVNKARKEGGYEPAPLAAQHNASAKGPHMSDTVSVAVALLSSVVAGVLILGRTLLGTFRMTRRLAGGKR